MEDKFYSKTDSKKIESAIVEKLKEVREEKMNYYKQVNKRYSHNPFTRLHLSTDLKEKTRFIKELEEGNNKLEFYTFINLCNKYEISSTKVLSEFITKDTSNEIKEEPLQSILQNSNPIKYDSKVFGDKIKKYRKLKKMSQRGLSQKLGFGHSYINNIENGTNDISISALINICNELECTPNDLLVPFINNKNDIQFNQDSPQEKIENNKMNPVKSWYMTEEERQEYNRKLQKRNQY